MDPRNERPRETDLEDADAMNPKEKKEDIPRAEEATFKSDEPEIAPEEHKKDRKDVERELDHGLKETFPASDPVSINPGAD